MTSATGVDGEPRRAAHTDLDRGEAWSVVSESGFEDVSPIEPVC